MSNVRLISFFSNTNLISLSAAKQIASNFEYKMLAKNELMLVEDHIANEYFFLEQGFMRSFAFDPYGNEVTTNFYKPGQMVFEVASFFNRTRSKENIQALTDCCGWFITYKQLNDLFHALPEFREFGRSTLVKGFAELKDRMLSTITTTAEERHTALLKTNPEIFQHAPLKQIATYLGITDTSLSRIRAAKAKK